MLRWSELTESTRPVILGAGYALAGALAAAEIAILALALSPNVSDDYRAYYIDKTTTCLNRDAVGRYTPGRTVSFRSDGAREATTMMVCGWSGPVADGTHSLGESSRLRLTLPPLRDGLRATLEMAAVIRPPQTWQRIVVSANGTEVYRGTLSGDVATTVSFVIPHAVLAGKATLDMAIEYPDGIPQSADASNIYNRAIKLRSFRLDTL
ncbi:MAG: hypothetical protein EOQ55_12655 [Mesorhizobium sp.]|nr:hypothetical protein EJ078_29630 [Mesorhizobium sp. M1A.F.Ca.IN.022.06.1.1]PBB30807.1 hypothetical protein CK214_19425 [Mesorhizobium sp. WSM3882]RUU99317.1 hypothetical protein EOA79_22060 [Mesorhizobium sp. M1A.F.Ca.IN.020.03.2.1]RUV13282.1 hypothetical protein EOA91_26465 [Mesorhizobium sp. M1A.F.Ca.IN.022.04.1.1]RUV41145.1 hypothetical protein EOD29_25510 [Mesorhizobium sp. M1A.T.Ca.IN.004.03.1.1]RUV60396.1 hypothetical protein EOA64_18190 [Mesorhizobium sp. M1A.F.Ca.IN.022.02.1.1]RUV7